MATTKLGENVVHTSGELPASGSKAPDFTLTGIDLKDVGLANYAGKYVIMNIFPSVDTSTCAASVRAFNVRAASLTNTVVLCISRDLPFAMRRFCGAEGIDKVVSLSDFRNYGFAKSYGVEMTEGSMKGLFARAIVVIGPEGKVAYSKITPTVGEEPDYDAAIAATRQG